MRSRRRGGRGSISLINVSMHMLKWTKLRECCSWLMVEVSGWHSCHRWFFVFVFFYLDVWVADRQQSCCAAERKLLLLNKLGAAWSLDCCNTASNNRQFWFLFSQIWLWAKNETKPDASCSCGRTHFIQVGWWWRCQGNVKYRSLASLGRSSSYCGAVGWEMSGGNVSWNRNTF